MKIYFRSIKTALLVSGLWKINQGDHKASKLYEAYSLTFKACYLLFVISLCKTDSSRGRQDRLFSLYVMLFHLPMILKFILIHTKFIRGIIRKLDIREDFLLNHENLEVKSMYLENVVYAKKVFILYLPFVMGAGVAFAIDYATKIQIYLSTINSGTMENITINKPLPFLQWIPFDADAHFVALLVLDVAGMSVTVTINLVLDGIIIFLIISITSHLRVLNYFLSHLKYVDFQNEGSLGLKWCIKYHQILIRAVNDFDNRFKHIMFCDFCFRAVQTAGILFEVTQSKNASLQLLFFCFLIMFVAQMAIYYYQANELTRESENIQYAAYSNNWYKASQEDQKLLKFIILRSSKPLVLHVGLFYDMSNETLLKILKSIYSILAVFNSSTND